MRVRMLLLAAGPEVALAPGQEVDLKDTLAKALIAVGAAVSLDKEAPPPLPPPPLATKPAKGKNGPTDRDSAA